MIWIECYRNIGMSIARLKEYIMLCAKGKETAPKRLEIILEQKQKILRDREYLNKMLEKIELKEQYYIEMIKENKDYLNPESKDYKRCKK